MRRVTDSERTDVPSYTVSLLLFDGHLLAALVVAHDR